MMGKPAGGVDFKITDDNEIPLPAGNLNVLFCRHPAGRLSRYHKLANDKAGIALARA
jgi:hypothetical protein